MAQKQRSNSRIKTQLVELAKLKDHPRNYRTHPDDQIEHIIASIREHGFYRNVVVARGWVILAGHGVVKAARKMKLKKIPIIKLNLDPNSKAALKILAGDNEMGHLAEVDDRALIDIFMEINEDSDGELLGTGYDEQMLAALVFVTRTADEIQDFDEAAHWVGMPDYEMLGAPLKIIIQFRNEKDRAQFAKLLELEFTEKTRSSWWPARERDDVSALRFEQ